MYQQQTPQPRDERVWNDAENEYNAGYAGNPQQNDQLADAIARRLQAQAPVAIQVGAATPLNRDPTVISAGQRLALALVSVCALIPLAGITFGIFASTGLVVMGLVAMGIIGAVIMGINFAFNNHR
jgi:hypothetical protein